jgi:hypothetical protein
MSTTSFGTGPKRKFKKATLTSTGKKAKRGVKKSTKKKVKVTTAVVPARTDPMLSTLLAIQKAMETMSSKLDVALAGNINPSTSGTATFTTPPPRQSQSKLGQSPYTQRQLAAVEAGLAPLQNVETVISDPDPAKATAVDIPAVLSPRDGFQAFVRACQKKGNTIENALAWFGTY